MIEIDIGNFVYFEREPRRKAAARKSDVQPSHDAAITVEEIGKAELHRQLIAQAVAKHDATVTELAHELGIDRVALGKRMSEVPTIAKTGNTRRNDNNQPESVWGAL